MVYAMSNEIRIKLTADSAIIVAEAIRNYAGDEAVQDNCLPLESGGRLGYGLGIG